MVPAERRGLVMASARRLHRWELHSAPWSSRDWPNHTASRSRCSTRNGMRRRGTGVCHLGAGPTPSATIGSTGSRSGQPVSGIRHAVANPRGVSPLVVPQILVWTFTLVWLMAERGVGGGGRCPCHRRAGVGSGGTHRGGRWSDRMGSRLRPIRLIAIAAAVSMSALAVTDFAALAAQRRRHDHRVGGDRQRQRFGIHRHRRNRGTVLSGRALGTQNTSQLLTHAFVPPVFGALIGAFGYPAAFAVCALFLLAALPIVPDDREINEQS